MKTYSRQTPFVYLLLSLIIGIGGKTRFIKVPPNPLYIARGKTARFVWDYTADNRTEEFQLNSPAWSYYYADGTVKSIGHEHYLRNWSWIINLDTCPSRFLSPIIRVSKESVATLVISNLTINDSGTYGMDLLLKSAPPITSKIQLIVTTRPEFKSQFDAQKIVVLEGKDLNLSCSATGIPTPNVTWLLLKDQRKEMKSQGVGSTELVIRNINRHQNGTYQCQATNNPNEYPIENQIEVIIWYKPRITFLNVTLREKITLRCRAIGQPHPSIKWYYPNGMQVESGDTTCGSRMVLDIPYGNSSLYGLYTCNATNEAGWQEDYFNFSQTNRPTTVTDKEMTTKPYMKSKAASMFVVTTTARTNFITTPNLDKNAGKSNPEKAKYKLNLDIVVLLCALGAVLPIIVTVSVIIVLRKRCARRNNKENRKDEDDENIHPHTFFPEASNIVTYAEVRKIPIYAKVETSKERTDRQNAGMPIYAQVDKSKKRRPGQIIYAELEDLKSSAELQDTSVPPRYHATEYADIASLQKQHSSSKPEVIYETLPDYV